LVAIGLFGSPALAVKVADLTHIGGQRTNVLTGLGLVQGLKGTGDGGDYMPAIKQLASMLRKFQDTTTGKDLAASANVAIVTLTVTVPPTGVHEGDHLDVHVMSIGASSSLKEGRLFVTPMTGPTPGSGLFALSEGTVDIEDPSTPTNGVIHGG